MVYPSKRVALRGLVLLVTAAVLGLGLAIPGQVAAVDHGPVRVTPRTLPPASALAVIRTITLGGNGLGVAAGGQRTVGTADDTIYVASDDQVLSVIDPVTLSKVATVNVGLYPIGVAVHPDDTVYVVNAGADTMTVIRGRTLTVEQTLAVPDEPQAVAVGRASDDTLFISSRGTSHAITTLNARTLSGAVSTSVGLTNPTPFGLGLTQDDTAFIAAWPTVPRQFNSKTLAVTNLTSLSTGYIGVAVSSDDTVYMSNEGSNVVKSFKATTPGTVSSVSVASSPQGIAIAQDGTVYVANRDADKVTAIDPLTNLVDDSVNAGDGPYGIAVTRTGIVVTTNRFESRAQIIAPVSPNLTTTSAFAGETGSLSIGGLPAGVTVEDTTVTSISFGDDTVPWTRTPGTNTFSGVIPPGTGTVDVIVALKGGNRAYAGAFTYAVPPPPPPPTPADPPRGVTAVADDRSASVSWSAPASSGSYSISAYQAIASPGGRICLTSGLSCTVGGLANGTTYTFTVKALTGAGWTVASEPSNAVTPSSVPGPTITIAGTRTKQMASVSGTTTGVEMGAMLTPWVRLGGDFKRGTASALVSSDGTFTWARRVPPSRSLTVYFEGSGVRSNVVTLD